MKYPRCEHENRPQVKSCEECARLSKAAPNPDSYADLKTEIERPPLGGQTRPVTTRRRFMGTLALGLLAPPLAAEAQQPGKKVRIGVLSQGLPDPAAGLRLARPLRALGWVEGQNLVFESRFDESRPDRLPTLAAELVALNVDVIFTRGTPAALAAKATTATIPIVMIFVANPVRSGLVASLARPGGNITGTANLAADIFGKQLELLKEIVPRASTVGALFDPLNRAQTDQLHNELAAAAAVLAVKLHPLKVDASSALEAVFGEALRKRADALVIFPVGTGSVGRAVADLAIKHRLATITTFRTYTEQGMLASFSGSVDEQYQRAAVHIDKILRGARPADLPVEQPTKFELVINLKTAKALGLTIPQPVLLRADELIQ
jgi:putative ABC transport system substrate-binding protein